jgi:hypothetical protein
MITAQQELLLKQYKDKAFVNAILAEESCNYYNFIKNLINIPLIICNSVMVCVNSIITDQDTLKILNIILNASTGLILGMISNFKIYEKINQYHQLYIKYYKLSNLIDSKMTNELDNLNITFIEGIIDNYNNIGEGQDFAFPSSIRKRVKKQYIEKLSLPLSLSVDIVECEGKFSCCANKV